MTIKPGTESQPIYILEPGDSTHPIQFNDKVKEIRITIKFHK